MTEKKKKQVERGSDLSATSDDGEGRKKKRFYENIEDADEETE